MPPGSPGPRPFPAGGPATPVTSDDPGTGPQRSAARVFFERMEGVEEAIRGLRAALEEGPDAMARRQDLEPMARRQDLEPVLRGLEAIVSGLGASLEQASEGIRAELQVFQGLPAQLAEGMEAVRETLAELARAQPDADGDEVAARTAADLGQTIEERLEATEARLVERLGAVEAAIGRLAERVGQEIRREVDGAFRRVKDELGASRADLGSTHAALVALREEWSVQAETMSSMRADVATLRGAFERVDRLAEIVESLGRRRGFRELIETEQRLHRERVELSQRITGTGEELAQRATALEERLRRIAEAARLERLQSQVSERIASGVEDLRASLVEELGGRVSEGLTAVVDALERQVGEVLPGSVGEAVRAEVSEALPSQAIEELRSVHEGQREAGEAVAGLRQEVLEVRDRLVAGAEEREAALDEQASALQERMAGVEEAIQGDLVEAVYERMQRAFDRRFEALVQLVEARMRQALGTAGADERRGGRTRRGRE
jgi:hypothetical protein